jgi:hypothetical protein
MKSPIKIKLTKLSRNIATDRNEYKIVQLTGAITIWQNPTIRVGDIVDEKLAESLTRAYQVTVTV